MKGKPHCMYCLKEMESIKYWTFHGGFCTRCFLKYMSREIVSGLEIMNEEEIQELLCSDFYNEVYVTMKSLKNAMDRVK